MNNKPTKIFDNIIINLENNWTTLDWLEIIKSDRQINETLEKLDRDSKVDLSLLEVIST